MDSLHEKTFQEFETKIVVIFKEFCESGLLTLKLHFLDHMCKTCQGFKISHFWLHALRNTSIWLLKRAYSKSSITRAARMKEILEAMNRALKMLTGYQGSINAFALPAAITSKLQNLDLPGSAL